MRLPAWSKSFGVQVTIALIAGVILGLIAVLDRINNLRLEDTEDIEDAEVVEDDE